MRSTLPPSAMPRCNNPSVRHRSLPIVYWPQQPHASTARGIGFSSPDKSPGLTGSLVTTSCMDLHFTNLFRIPMPFRHR